MEGCLPASEKRFPVSPGVMPGVVMGVVVFDCSVSRFDISDGVAVSSPAAGPVGNTTGSCTPSAEIIGSSLGSEACGAFAVMCLARYLNGSSVISSE